MNIAGGDGISVLSPARRGELTRYRIVEERIRGVRLGVPRFCDAVSLQLRTPFQLAKELCVESLERSVWLQP